jgi:hypothetical protein
MLPIRKEDRKSWTWKKVAQEDSLGVPARAVVKLALITGVVPLFLNSEELQEAICKVHPGDEEENDFYAKN